MVSLNSEDLNLEPASLRMCVMSFAVYVEFGILERMLSIALEHSRDDLSFIPVSRNILECLSQKIRK